MFLKIIQTKTFIPGFAGITLYPFIFVKDKDNKRLVNHEKIHYEQQKELLVIGFYILYFLVWLKDGYENNMFEREAYENQYNYNYLKKRKRYNYF